MSESILRALMQLFALVAKVEGVSKDGRSIVKLFLKQQLSADLVQDYLNIFEEYLELHQKNNSQEGKARKKTSVNSVKVLRICTQINEELKQNQKIVVLIRLMEFLFSEDYEEQEFEFASTVASTFNIPNEEFLLAFNFLTSKHSPILDHDNCLLISNKIAQLSSAKNLSDDHIKGYIKVLKLDSTHVYLAVNLCDEAMYINGQIMARNRAYFLRHGSSIRNTKVNPIYFSDITSAFRKEEETQLINFIIDDLEYKFPAGNIGIHKMSLNAQSGNLIGIMGASGAGKSTFLSLLNGTLTPTSGKVTINGVDIHHQSKELEGIIGHVSQDDLLMEDLTVFQNLYFNAQLCYDNHSDSFLTKKTLELLKSIGLYETKDLKVGSPLEKTISGGQRKRLNIALELIREPQVLFVDEPTSGLSSRDSENIMDLLKELALKGKLVFVVIHQPSSDIFKLFDNLLILDTGGFTIYYGNPVDSVIYFKQIINHVNANESECFHCGNVNPEQIFNIIETKVVDEFGDVTEKRKFSPKTWSTHYLEEFEKPNTEITNTEKPKGNYIIPKWITQFKVFFNRDILSKLANKQYMYINFLEGPFLAFILSFMVKYFSTEAGPTSTYVFRYNENLSAYIFMSVVVALFMGLTVSAEEIIKDRKILKRESFLNLSWLTYLSSKVSILFIISAIQTLCYVIIGNLVLGIQGLYLDYWLVLFATSCFANLLGLNISSAFNSVITIYILIPILLIPQLLLGGVIVKFDKLHPILASQNVVPFSGDIMVSRWAFEALSVNQFKSNAFEKFFYPYDKVMSNASYKRNYWQSELKKRLETCKIYHDNTEKKEWVEQSFRVIQNEIYQEVLMNPSVVLKMDLENLMAYSSFDIHKEKVLSDYLNEIKNYYNNLYNAASVARNKMMGEVQKSMPNKEDFIFFRDNYQNENLSDLVKNSNTVNKVIEFNNELIQKVDPIYLDGQGLRAHFFAPTKQIFGKQIDTFWVNLGVIWLLSTLLFITLYYNTLKKLLDLIEIWSNKFSYAKKK
jgi:ABC-type multidrug transport system ATPase subunit